MPRTRNSNPEERESSINSVDPKRVRRRSKNGCMCCRARKKKCNVPLSKTEDCENCKELNIQCLRGYGEKRPQWMQNKERLKEFTHAITDWTGKPYNRTGDASRPSPLRLDRFRETSSPAPASPSSNPQGNASGSYTAYTIAFSISSTTTSTSSTDAPRRAVSDVLPYHVSEFAQPTQASSSTSAIRTHSAAHSSASTTDGSILQSSAGLIDPDIPSSLQTPARPPGGLEFQARPSSSGGRPDPEGLEQSAVDPRLLTIRRGRGFGPFVYPSTSRRW